MVAMNSITGVQLAESFRLTRSSYLSEIARRILMENMFSWKLVIETARVLELGGWKDRLKPGDKTECIYSIQGASLTASAEGSSEPSSEVLIVVNGSYLRGTTGAGL